MEEVHALLRAHKIRPNQLRGQHFLIRDEVYAAILEAAALSDNDDVLEVGPGLGTLTRRLADVAQRVVAVEIEPSFVRLLTKQFRDNTRVAILAGDILKLPVVRSGLTPPYRVVANIPYYLTGKLLRKFLAEDTQPVAMTLLIQREVAKRLVAKPGHMNLVAINAQLYSTPRIVREVPPSAFFPKPTVESAVVHLAEIHPYAFPDVPEKFFWRTVKVGFSSPRKQLKNTLAAGFPSIDGDILSRAIEVAGARPVARAQELSVEQWHHLAAVLQPHVQ